MIFIKVTIEGQTGLICNRFTDEAAASASSGTRMAVIGDKGTEYEQADKKLYRDEAGKLCIPAPNLFRCIIDAGTFHKAGKSKVTTMKSSMIPACVYMHGEMLPIEHKEPWQVDTRPVRIPSAGGRILAHRPKFNDWRLSFEIELDDSMMTEKIFRAIIDDAGARIGLGDFRPACKGMFGKFKVIKWDAQRPKQPKTPPQHAPAPEMQAAE